MTGDYIVWVLDPLRKIEIAINNVVQCQYEAIVAALEKSYADILNHRATHAIAHGNRPRAGLFLKQSSDEQAAWLSAKHQVQVVGDASCGHEAMLA